MTREDLDALERIAAGEGALQIGKTLLRALIEKARQAEAMPA